MGSLPWVPFNQKTDFRGVRNFTKISLIKRINFISIFLILQFHFTYLFIFNCFQCVHLSVEFVLKVFKDKEVIVLLPQSWRNPV